jgi:polyphenol oxidase
MPASIRPSIFAAWPGVVAAMSTRLGGEGGSPFGMNLSTSVGDDPDRVERNRSAFFRDLGIELKELAIPGQVHSSVVRIIQDPGPYPSCDGLVTTGERVFLCVTVADCLPILMLDPEHQAIAAVHAGWRGTVSGITRTALSLMVEHFKTDPAQIVAFIGPGAGVCCYQVGEEVAGNMNPRFVLRRDSSVFLDLKGANEHQLESLGVPRENVEVHPSCTIGERDRFHSYRRDREHSGRMMAVLGLSNRSIR